MGSSDDQAILSLPLHPHLTTLFPNLKTFFSAVWNFYELNLFFSAFSLVISVRRKFFRTFLPRSDGSCIVVFSYPGLRPSYEEMPTSTGGSPKTLVILGSILWTVAIGSEPLVRCLRFIVRREGVCHVDCTHTNFSLVRFADSPFPCLSVHYFRKLF